MTRGKKIAIILVSVFIVVGGLFGAIFHTVNGARKELNDTLQPMLSSIASSEWDKDIFESYSSPALKQWFAKNGYGPLEQYKKLGKLINFYGVEEFNVNSEASESISQAQFENGKVYIRLGMSKHDGVWLINNINIREMQ